MATTGRSKVQWTDERKAAHRAIRARAASDRPSLAEGLASGEFEEPTTLSAHVEFRVAMRDLKRERERLGLSLADVAARSGIDKAALSRLENGQLTNPTIATLARYADALGKAIDWRFVDRPDGPGGNAGNGSPDTFPRL